MLTVLSGDITQVVDFVAVDSTDLKTRETSLSSTAVYRARGGGSATAMTTPTITAYDTTNMPGVFKLLLDEDMTITAGKQSEVMTYHITSAEAAPVTISILLVSPPGFVRRNTAQGGASSSITLDASASATTDFYAGCFVFTAAGTGALQGRIITAYNGTSKVATVDRAWATNPDNTTTFELYAGSAPTTLTELVGAIWNAATSSYVVSGSMGEMLGAGFLAAGADPASVPAVNASRAAKLDWLCALARNKVTQTATTQILKADDGSTTVGTSTISDDGTTFTRGEFA